MYTIQIRVLIVIAASLVSLIVAAAVGVGRVGFDAYRAGLTAETVVLDIIQAIAVAAFTTWTVTRAPKRS